MTALKDFGNRTLGDIQFGGIDFGFVFSHDPHARFDARSFDDRGGTRGRQTPLPTKRLGRQLRALGLARSSNLIARSRLTLDRPLSRPYAFDSRLEATLKAFRRLLQRTPFYGAYKAIGHYPDYWYWILRGRPERSPHLLKQKVVREYGERFGLKTLVETGTYYGEMVAAMKRRFARIYSIEFVPELAERAQRKFAGEQHIKIFRGDSRVVMPQVLGLMTAPALFWLDAGYYGWIGKQGDQQRLSAELEMILSHPYSHIILLDDARGLTGRDGVPSVADVKAYVEGRFPGRQVRVEYDIMRVTTAS